MTDFSKSAVIMLFSCGLWAGAVFMIAIERTRAWQQMEVADYFTDFRRSVGFIDPAMPILCIIALVAAIVFGLHHTGAAALFSWIGVALIGLVVVGGVAISAPIVFPILKAPEGAPPPNLERRRAAWRWFHLGRTTAAMATFLCLTCATALGGL